MWEQFMLVPVSELQELELTCPKCKGVTIFNLKEHSRLPDRCPLCTASWNGFSNKNVMTAYESLTLFFAIFGDEDMQMKPKFRVFAQKKT